MICYILALLNLLSILVLSIIVKTQLLTLEVESVLIAIILVEFVIRRIRLEQTLRRLQQKELCANTEKSTFRIQLLGQTLLPTISLAIMYGSIYGSSGYGLAARLVLILFSLSVSEIIVHVFISALLTNEPVEMNLESGRELHKYKIQDSRSPTYSRRKDLGYILVSTGFIGEFADEEFEYVDQLFLLMDAIKDANKIWKIILVWLYFPMPFFSYLIIGLYVHGWGEGSEIVNLIYIAISIAGLMIFMGFIGELVRPILDRNNENSIRNFFSSINANEENEKKLIELSTRIFHPFKIERHGFLRRMIQGFYFPVFMYE